MPNWTPGSYLIRDYAANVEGLQARGETGTMLSVRKLAKNHWQVEAAGEKQIEVTYSVWAGELAVNAAWVESGFAVLSGAGIFLYNEHTRRMPQHVIVNLPESWPTVHVALPQQENTNGFLAQDYDELVDSPILAGNSSAYPFNVDGQDYMLVNQGDEIFWDSTQAAADLQRIVRSIQQFWQNNPLDRPYLFLNVISMGSGGLEHDSSTVLMSSPWQMRSRGDYVRWLSLAAHEFFHVWNVRRLRPQALSHYDYEHETYTRELWIAEGLTSYYDNLLLFRSGLISVDEYLGLLADEMLKYETSPGRKVRSAEEASFDAWIKHYKPDANSINSDASYYRRGSLIGFVADQKIRRATNDKHSLDDIMRDLYRLYGSSVSGASEGYPPGAFEALVEQRAGESISREISSLLTTVTDPDVDAALDYYGLLLEREPVGRASEATGTIVPTDFGLVWSITQPALLVESVVRGGSGAEAGVLPGDELLAINSHRVDRFNIQDRMLRLQPGEVVELLLARNARVLTLPVRVQNAIPEKYRINIQPDINRREKLRMENWLGLQLSFRRN
jgi:predicted metalloprotease with PDZ domain